MSPSLDRRRLAATALLAMTLIPLRITRKAFAGDRGNRPELEFAQLFADPRAAIRLGRLCLARGLVPADTGSLRRRLAGGCRDDGRLRPAAVGPELWRIRLHERIREDWARGAVRNLDGWIVAEAELAGWALAALGARLE